MDPNDRTKHFRGIAMNHGLLLRIFSTTLILVVIGGNTSDAGSSLMGKAVSYSIVPDDREIPLAGTIHPPRRRIIPFSEEGSFCHFFNPPKSQYDPIEVKALGLKDAEGDRLFFITIDTLLITGDFTAAVRLIASSYGIRPHEIVIGASHSHSAPGGLIKNSFIEIAINDTFSGEYLAFVLSRIGRAFREILNGFEPVKVGSAWTTTSGLTRNRRVKAGQVDERLGMIKITDLSGKPVALLINFGVHGTTLPGSARILSSEVMGLTTQKLKSLHQGAQVLFFNGVEGDVEPSYEGSGGIGEMERLSSKLAAIIARRLPEIVEQTELDITTRMIEPDTPRSDLSIILGCLRSLYPKTPSFGNAWSGRLLFPGKTTIFQAIRLGATLILTIPGEPLTRLGVKIRDLFPLTRNLFLFSLANDYIGYLPAREDFSIGEGHETCLTPAGQNTEAWLLTQLKTVSNW